jgi:hypothetical protein
MAEGVRVSRKSQPIEIDKAAGKTGIIIRLGMANGCIQKSGALSSGGFRLVKR